jgi:threonylcarbamoyladenosine tRNA methylthiotransferase MtaB
MGRRTTPKAYLKHLELARDRIPDIHISTDIIVGFPGETQTEFEESLEFIQQCEFAGGHIFTYSEREATPAASLPGPVPFPVRKERNRQVGSLIQKSAERYRKRFLGCELEVLWESGQINSTGRWELGGYTDNYLRVRTESPENLENKITHTRLLTVDGSHVTGEILTDYSE